MADNIRGNSLPFFYSSHEDEEENERRHDYTNANDMKLCAYCGFEFASCYVHGNVIRHGKTRQMYRCDRCKQEMQTYKPTDWVLG